MNTFYYSLNWNKTTIELPNHYTKSNVSFKFKNENKTIESCVRQYDTTSYSSTSEIDDTKYLKEKNIKNV